MQNTVFQFEIGDVVSHRHLGHTGVVVAKLPILLESDDWVIEQLGSLDDERLRAPWYIILVEHNHELPPNFVRFGSQLTHKLVARGKPIGFHRYVPRFFKGFDDERRKYIALQEARPLTKTEQGTDTLETASKPAV